MKASGRDKILDFEDGQDKIVFGDNTYTYKQLKIRQVGDDVEIVSANGVVTLVDMNIADLNKDDFIFWLTSTGDNFDSSKEKTLIWRPVEEKTPDYTNAPEIAVCTFEFGDEGHRSRSVEFYTGIYTCCRRLWFRCSYGC